MSSKFVFEDKPSQNILVVEDEPADQILIEKNVKEFWRQANVVPDLTIEVSLKNGATHVVSKRQLMERGFQGFLN